MNIRAMKWSFLLNRYMITLGAVATLAGLWNLYVAFNNEGIVRGQVVDQENRPVEGASVTLFQKTIYVAEPRGTAITDKSGHFQFTDHKSYRFWLEAAKDGVGKSPKVEYRLYFRNQNLTLTEPLRLERTP